MSKVVTGARAKVYIDNQLVGIFESCTISNTTGTEAIHLLGRYSLMYCTYLRDKVIAEDFFVRIYRKTVTATPMTSSRSFGKSLGRAMTLPRRSPTRPAQRVWSTRRRLRTEEKSGEFKG